MRCPGPDTLAAALWQTMRSRTQPDAVWSHVERCPLCSEQLAELARLYVSSPGHHADRGSASSRSDRASSWHARFSIRAVLGAGGMGAVFEAYDARLRRSVALKLLSHDDAMASGAERLRHEARALARLAHPNVVEILDLYVDEEPSCIVMELVDGGTLRRWATSRRRPWKQIATLGLQAAHALSAVHRLGLVHGDIKPDNLLIRNDSAGPVLKVADFGLARARGGARDPDGKMRGTAAYMPPEQRRGGPATPSSDQFALAVTLVELLTGRHPFIESSGHRPPRGDVPPAMFDLLDRAMADRLEDRWPSMDVFADRLATVLRPRPRLVVGAMIASVVVAGLVVVGAARDSRPASCTDELRWSPTLEPATEGAWRTAIEAYDRHWNDALRDVCFSERGDAARERGNRLRCLERDRRVIDALVARTERPADAASFELLAAGPSRCLSGATGSPAGVGELPDAVLDRWAGLVASQLLSDHHAAFDVFLAQLRADARRSRDPWLSAEVERSAGARASEDLEYVRAAELLESAYFQAEAHGLSDVAFESALALVGATAKGRELDRAERWSKVARTLALRSNDRLWQARSARVHAQYLLETGAFESAVDGAAAALAAALEVHGAESPMIPAALSLLSAALLRSRRVVEARLYATWGLAAARIAWGVRHPAVGNAAALLAQIEGRLGQLDAALALAHEAAAIFEDSLGRSHPLVQHTRSLVGSLHLANGQPSRASELFEQVLTDGPERPDQEIADTERLLALALLRSGRLADALMAVVRGTERVGKVRGPSHPDLVRFYDLHGSIATQLGRLDEARVYYGFARDLALATQTDVSARLVTTASLGHVMTRLGRLDEALELLVEAEAGLRERGLRGELADTLAWKGAALQGLKRWDQAERCLHEALGLYGNDEAERANVLDVREDLVRIERARRRPRAELRKRVEGRSE